MRIHDTALKHGIDPEDIMRAAAWPLWIEDLDDDSPARQLRLGFDTQGRLLESVVLIFRPIEIVHRQKPGGGGMRKALTARSIAVISAFPAAAAFMLAIVLPSQFAALCWGAGILLLVTALTSAIVGFRAISSSSERS